MALPLSFFALFLAFTGTETTQTDKVYILRKQIKFRFQIAGS